ncbi:hypothetical protein D3C74_421810 [compost metagenome]
MRIVLRMTDNAPGSVTFQNFCPVLAPMLVKTSYVLSGIALTPSRTEMMTWNSRISIIISTLEVSPRPKNSMTTGSSAIFGIG